MNREYELEKVLDGLVDIVERVGCGDWRNEQGVRLKDTPQWVNAYVALHKNHAQPAAPVAQVPEGYLLVPVQPTKEMRKAGRQANGASMKYQGNECDTIYRAMLAAAQPAGEKP